jgi:hypothetical protein
MNIFGHEQRCLIEAPEDEERKPMTRRLAVWFLIGFSVACGWVWLFIGKFPPAPSNRAFWTVVDITAPAALLRHFPLKYYWFILLNALVYTLVGFGVELLRSKHSLSHASVR